MPFIPKYDFLQKVLEVVQEKVYSMSTFVA